MDPTQPPPRSERTHPDFATFVAARQQALQRYAYLVIGDVALAEDLVQEALAKTYARWGRVRDQGNPEAYVRRAITTTAISWSRRRGFRGEVPTERLPEGHGHEASTVQADPGDGVSDAAALGHALRRLPPRQRAAVVLRFYEDLSEAQTAEVLGCAVGTVKSQVSAALTRLRLDPDLPDLQVVIR